MKQLSALDNLMLEGELPRLPMHMSAIMIYDTGGKRGSSRLRETMLQRFQDTVETHFPILHCKAERLPLHLDRSYWVEDPDFSVNNHFTHVALPKNQDWPALYRLFGDFHAQPLDTSRPLWQVMYVEGLDRLEGIPRGATAVFLKIHHSVIDGRGAFALIRSFHNVNADPGSEAEAGTLELPGIDDSDFRAPSFVEKYGRAWWHSIERPIELAGTILKLLPQLLQIQVSKGGQESSSTPHSIFNTAFEADRVVGHVRLDINELNRLKKEHQCTINDIALCVIAGALRGYLSDRGALPQENMRTLMPVNIRTSKDENSIGNHVSVANVCLHTCEKSASARLRAIKSDTSLAKKKTKRPNSLPLLDLVDEIHPAVILWLGQWLISSGHIDDLPDTVNTVVTNVPGILGDAFIGDAKLVDYLGFGPLAPNVGLFHTVSSAADQVNISFLSTAELLGDGESYRAAIARSWAELSSVHS